MEDNLVDFTDLQSNIVRDRVIGGGNNDNTEAIMTDFRSLVMRAKESCNSLQYDQIFDKEDYAEIFDDETTS